MSAVSVSTPQAFSNDRTDLLGRVDLTALFLEVGMVQGRNRQWSCPDPAHAQTGATPPVSIGGPAGDHLWKCHGCPAGGSAVDLVRLARGLDTAGAFAFLRGRFGSPAYLPPAPRPAKAATRPPDPDLDRLEGDKAAEVLGNYLTTRQWSTDAAEAFGLFAVHGRWGRPRVRHPYRIGGVTRWWQDRAVYPDDTGPKWTNPTGLSRQPYALDLRTTVERTTEFGRVFVCEGPADVIALWHAAPGAAVVGIPGTQGLNRWRPLLYGLDVFLLTDPDEAGDRAAAELAQLVHDSGGRSVRPRPPADVDDWRRLIGNEALAGSIVALCEPLDWWAPAEGLRP